MPGFQKETLYTKEPVKTHTVTRTMIAVKIYSPQNWKYFCKILVIMVMIGFIVQFWKVSEPFRCQEQIYRNTSELWQEFLKNTMKARPIDKGSSFWDTSPFIDSCKPKNHIFFLKTHKTASSTVMNILFRFGDSRNLAFAFPFQSQFSYPSFFSSKFVKGFTEQSNKEFHIMCHHMRFQLSEVEKVMPNDTFYFTILRNPISQMESSFSYYRNTGAFQKAKSLDEFLKNTSMYYIISKGRSYYAKNSMAFDLGFDHNTHTSAKQLKLVCHMVESMFDLVLISDYFDESLVLLKNALCWSLDDILSIPLNSRSNTTKRSLSKDTQEKIKTWSQIDWHLYTYFNRSFWNQVEKYGRERMERDVEELRRKRNETAQACLQGEVDPKHIRDKSLAPYQSGIARILGYNLKPGLKEIDKRLCQRLVTPELQYSTLLHDKSKNAT
uniref:Galactose-3-O-sulfotransferase 2 n=1 Tax=Leptobrachium leishanense TaxID=445787 RepID=A0A8C5MT38_9ANUR